MFDPLPALRTYLVAQGVARDPDTVSALPPMWLDPRLGIPAPGEKPERGSEANRGDPVLAALLTGGFPTGPYEGSYWRYPTVDLRIRSSKAPPGKALGDVLTNLLHDKRDWNMGGVQVIESLESRPLSPIASDAQGWDFVVGFRFQLYAH